MNGSTYLRAAALGIVVSALSVPALAVGPAHTPPPFDDNLDITGASGTLSGDGSVIVFEQTVVGTAHGTPAGAFGTPDGAPVIGHVFPTTLNSSDIGFGADEGLVALAITDHPDFDDTPLVDESGDGDFGNDGGLIHSHWVVLVTDDTRVDDTNISVKELDPNDQTVIKPATHPGLPIFIDSPNFFVEAVGDTISVHVPVGAVNNRTDFNFDALTAYLEVRGDAQPLLGVYEVYDVLSGDLSLPFSIVVPEPASAAMLALGLAGLVGIRRRR